MVSLFSTSCINMILGITFLKVTQFQVVSPKIFSFIITSRVTIHVQHIECFVLCFHSPGLKLFISSLFKVWSFSLEVRMALFALLLLFNGIFLFSLILLVREHLFYQTLQNLSSWVGVNLKSLHFYCFINLSSYYLQFCCYLFSSTSV